MSGSWQRFRRKLAVTNADSRNALIVDYQPMSKVRRHPEPLQHRLIWENTIGVP